MKEAAGVLAIRLPSFSGISGQSSKFKVFPSFPSPLLSIFSHFFGSIFFYTLVTRITPKSGMLKLQQKTGVHRVLPNPNGHSALATVADGTSACSHDDS